MIDQDAVFTKLYHRYADAIFRHCYYRLAGDRQRAIEYTQESFLRLWQQMQKDGSLDNPKAFVYRVATNLIIDASKKKKEASLELMQEQGYQPADTHDLHHEVDTRMAHDQLMEQLHTLPDDYKQVLLLRYVDGFSPQEIAHLIEDSVNSVSVRITRAKKKLRELVS